MRKQLNKYIITNEGRCVLLSGLTSVNEEDKCKKKIHIFFDTIFTKGLLLSTVK